MVTAAADRGDEQRAYHHGHLRDALVDAGVELARAGGPSAVSLRAVSRQAGVSHNAAYRHFANQEDLLAAVAAQCITRLGQLMIERSALVTTRGRAERARDRLAAIGRAYIDFARSEPGWFRTAFTSARAHPSEPPTREPTAAKDPDDATNPYVLLNARLDEMVDAGALAPKLRGGAEYAAWAAVHGLSSLLLDGPLRDLPESEIEYAISSVLAVVSRGL
jgi:AcrR family transcriptional regulator